MAARATGGSSNLLWQDRGGSWPSEPGGGCSGRVIVGGPGPNELVGGRGEDIQRGDTEDYSIDGRSGVDAAQVVGTNDADDLAVGRNIAVDDPGLYARTSPTPRSSRVKRASRSGTSPPATT